MMAIRPQTDSSAKPGGAPDRPIPRWTHVLDLTKPRLSLLSVITVLVGYMAARPAIDGATLGHLMVGTSLAAGGAAALNQWWERSTDAGMRRTRTRPLPAGHLRPGSALAAGLLLCLVGTAQLALWVNLAAALLLAVTVSLYVLVYTPIKKRTHWCTEVGAVSGALPPAIGWAAAEGGLGPGGWILFGILAFWQMPHFHAIAWLYRRDYAAVGFPMLAVIDPQGKRVGRHMTAHGLLLLLFSLGPVAFGFAGFFYGAAALILNGLFLGRILRFNRAGAPDDAARRIFLASLAFLPLLLGTLVIDIWFFAN